MAKNSMISLLPRYNATRMVTEYTRNFYVPASRQGALYSDDDFSGAKKIAAWKAFVRRAWGGVRIRRLDTPTKRISFGDALHFDVALRLSGLQPEDVIVELLVCRQSSKAAVCDYKHFRFDFTGREDRESNCLH